MHIKKHLAKFFFFFFFWTLDPTALGLGLLKAKQLILFMTCFVPILT